MTDLKTKIMRRIYVIWFSRQVLPYLIMEAAIFGVFAYLIAQNVFVAKVVEYAGLFFGDNSKNPAALISFVFRIFGHTRLIVQISVLGSIAMLALMFKHFIKSAIQLAISKETNIAGRAF